MRFLIPAAALLLACSGLAAAQSSIRCDSRLAQVGDWDFQLRETCGEPFFVDRWREVVSVSAAPGVAVSTPVEFEDWYFDHGGNRFLQRARLRDGRIVDVRALSSYGRQRPLAECRGASVRTGLSSGELVSLCGAPAQRRELGQALVIGESPAESVIPTRHERWLYPLSGDRWLIVEMLRGRVAMLDTTPAR
jgi:hypothetical protein